MIFYTAVFSQIDENPTTEHVELGAEQARATAEPKVERVKETVGFVLPLRPHSSVLPSRVSANQGTTSPT